MDQDALVVQLLDEVRSLKGDMAILISTVRDQGLVIGIMSDQIRELHSRFIEMSDSTGRRIRALEKKSANGKGT